MYTSDADWQKICPVCGNHKGEHIEMIINEGPHSMFYSCPKYYPENRTEDERACANRINLIEYQKMVEKLNDMIADAACNGGKIDLTNYTWTEKGIQYKVVSHNTKTDTLTVEILNKKALS